MWTTIAIIAILIIYIISIYNGLVSRRNQAREAWSTIDTQLKRRLDLIPNLVATVKGAAAHEATTLSALTRARTAAENATTAPARAAAESKVSGALSKLIAVAENYPTIRANENFLSLQSELSDTETKIQSARQFYNTVVMDLNTRIEQFPSNVIANLFRVMPEELFQMSDADKKAADKAPKVEF